MTVNPHLQKLKLIELIMAINDTDTLSKIELEAHKIKNKSEGNLDVFEAIRPMRENVSIEQIMEEQNYKPVTYVEFRAIADKIEIEEPIEELLAMLTK